MEITCPATGRSGADNADRDPGPIRPALAPPQPGVKGEPLRASTVVDYARALRLYINPYLGGRAVGDITRADIRRWHNIQLQKVSDRPKSKAYSLLRTIMNSAVEQELIDVSPVSPVSIRGGVTRRKHGIEPATLDELQIIVEAMPSPSQTRPHGMLELPRADASQPALTPRNPLAPGWPAPRQDAHSATQGTAVFGLPTP